MITAEASLLCTPYQDVTRGLRWAPSVRRSLGKYGNQKKSESYWVRSISKELSATPDEVTAVDLKELERYVVLLYSCTSPFTGMKTGSITSSTVNLKNIPLSRAALLQHVKRTYCLPNRIHLRSSIGGQSNTFKSFLVGVETRQWANFGAFMEYPAISIKGLQRTS